MAHIDYEPNWETGFFMQLWIMPVIEAMIAWSTSDVSAKQNDQVWVTITGCRTILRDLTNILAVRLGK